jgi:hypothetical protein
MHLPFRLPAALLLTAFLSAAPTSAADLEIVRVLTGWHSAESFHRVSEYFGGKENSGGITVLRTQSAEHSGYYWLVRLKNQGAPLPGIRFELQVISPSAPEPKPFTFAADIPSGGSVYQLGLTGPDWPGAKSRPVAWHLRLLAADGKTLLAKESFLWERPEKK